MLGVQKLARRCGLEITKRRFRSTDPELYADVGASPVIIDVGAHYGALAMDFGNAFPAALIWAIEGHPDNFAVLEHNTRALRARITPVHQVLGAEEGQSWLYEGDVSFTSSLLPTPTGRKRRVDVSTLSVFCRAHEIDRIDILKLDVEGAEIDVLTGGADLLERRRIRYVLAEAGLPNRSPGSRPITNLSDLWALVVVRYGYQPVGLYDVGYQPDGRLKNMNVLFKAPSAPAG
ncbi:MAG: FkbM family methyltransferase [Geminicoccales bacterium]